MSTAMESVLQLEEVPAGIVAQRHVHHRTQHRVRLVGEGAQATALKAAAPWLSWLTAASGEDTLPLGEVLLLDFDS